MKRVPFEVRLAGRYLKARRGRGAARFTAWAAIVGVACGVAAFIIAQGLARGFEDELRSKILRGTAHLTVTRADTSGIANWREAKREIEKINGVQSVSVTSYDGVLIASPTGTTGYAVVRGVAADVDATRDNYDLKETMIVGTIDKLFDDKEQDGDVIPLIVGAKLAEQLDLKLGDVVTLASKVNQPPAPTTHTSTSADDNTEDAQRAAAGRGSETTRKIDKTNGASFMPPFNIASGRVVGMFRSGLQDYDASWVYASWHAAAKLTGEGEAVRALAIEVENFTHAPQYAAQIKQAAESAGGYDVRDAEARRFQVASWTETNRSLFAALELERHTVAAIILLITLIACLNIAATLALTVTERRAEIAILRAMGARTTSIVKVFVVEGLAFGAAGVTIGVCAGLSICWAANRWRWVSLPSDVYAIAYVPLHPQAEDALTATAAAMLICFVATLYPARLAARVKPAELLREK